MIYKYYIYVIKKYKFYLCAALCILNSCSVRPPEYYFAKEFYGPDNNFAAPDINVVYYKQLKLYEMAIDLEKRSGFHNLNADSTIGDIALRLYIIDKKRGNTGAAENFKNISINRLSRCGNIPNNTSIENKNDFFIKECHALILATRPAWDRSEWDSTPEVKHSGPIIE